MTRTYHLLSLAVVAAAVATAACAGLDTSQNTGDNGNAFAKVPVVFQQSDMRGTWRFTVEGVETEAEYDANGNQLSGDTPLPASLRVSSDGAVDGSFSQAGGSGTMFWMRSWTYAGRMANDKQQISGTCTEKFNTTDGSDKDIYEWSAVKTGEGTADVATEVDTAAVSSQSSVLGTWSGQGQQSGSSWAVELNVTGLTGRCAEVSYPSLNCGGYWQCESSTTELMVVAREYITENTAACLSDYPLTCSINQGKLDCNWDSGLATATLEGT